MKKFRNLFKVVACLAVCFTVFIGNPIKTDAGWWSCAWNGHKLYTYYIPPTCQSYGYVESTCDCGKYYWKETCWDIGLGAHCYSTNPREVPTCIYCGCTK